MKIHRVRLSDKEIEIIRKALLIYMQHIDALIDQGKIDDKEYEETRKLTLRFIDWGRKRQYYERPFFRRPHRKNK